MHAALRAGSACKNFEPKSGTQKVKSETDGDYKMFIVLLRFAKNKSKAGQFIEGHKAWIKRGFDDGVFMMTGSLQPSLGGGIIAHGISHAELERRLNEDPFVAENVVSAEIIELAPSRADERLAFLA
jgi:uncharacterized protein YciI